MLLVDKFRALWIDVTASLVREECKANLVWVP